MPSSTPSSPLFFWGDTPEDEYYASQGIRNSKSYFQTPNAKIFTQSWLPLDPNQPIKATIFMTHGYTSNCSWSFQEICIAYAKWGYAVYAADLIGHGDSNGIRGYMGDMNKAAATSLSYFVSVRKSEEYCDLPAYLFGESMGGLITMLMYLQSETGMWSGLIFLAPLFVIPEEMISKLHLALYGLLFGLADTWAVMPDFRVGRNVVKDVEKLKKMVLDPKRYAGKLRVGTAREALRMTDYVQNNFDKVTIPFLALHGTLDGLALHSGSEMLYEKAMTAKEDKGLKLYEGMYHSLINGEPDENVDLVLADMKTWIDEQTMCR
ncbi:hypothetical protein CTI12_AA318200 [Artemisia annua]|uniref:Serine aminopeptidase S33 domain-containing protein n=1 Tax=Artemisia annua TaxID=35608 RepID=A0A2U1N1W4_ARTAN|nr:hypothetical protein CTI12_AA318200 [Artemisia annua]